MSRQDFARQAKAVLERRRQRAETAAELRREEIYAAIPELAELDAQKTQAGVAAARFATEGAHDKAQEKLQAVRRLAKRREQLLAQKQLTPGDLEPQYHCKACADTGRAQDGSACECLKAEVLALRRSEVNEAGPLRLCRFENFDLSYYPQELEGVSVSPRTQMGGILQGCQDWAADFGPHSESLLLYGDAGLGKTHLALSMASAVLDKGYDVIYVSAQGAFAQISQERFTGSELFSSMLEADLLVLDDLGTEFMDAYVLSRLYELVNARLQRPTIFTSNICRREMLEQRYTEKIASRLLGECRLMRFFGRDIRLQKKAN